MAENVPQTTDAGPVEDVRDTDSGIDPGSAQSTPSQSVDSTPSSSERSTPVLSPSNPGTSESFSFPPEAFSGLQIQSATEGQESMPSTMDVDSSQQTASINQGVPPAPACPQMDNQGFYRAPDPPRMTRQGFSRPPSAPQMTRPGSSRPRDPPSSTIEIFIRNFNGELKRFQISQDANVEDLTKMIHEQMGIPPSQQRLVYQGKEFRAGNSLQSYSVRNLSEISLLGRLRGGHCDSMLQVQAFMWP